MKIKLLEAMAYGTPVVTTNEGAEGLSAMEGVRAFIAAEDDAIVEDQFSPGPVVAQMESIYHHPLAGIE